MLGSLRVWILLVALALMAPFPSATAEAGVSNVLFETTVPAPITHLATDSSGGAILIADEEARFTLVSGLGATERSWVAPASGRLATLDPALGEVAPLPRGAAVTADGSLWAGAVAYDDEFAGAVHGFGHWSDEPIWRFDLPDPDVGEDADQPRVIKAGGPYYVIGTEQGTVYLLIAEADEGQSKTAHRTYTQDNVGNLFETINDVAISADGTRVLIGTGMSGERSLHLFTDTFFKSSFKRIEAPIQHVDMNAEGTRGLAITGQGANARAHLLDLDNGATIWETTIGTDVGASSFSPDGKVLAIGGTDGEVRIFHERDTMDDRSPVFTQYLASSIVGIDLADDGHSFAAATQDGIIHYLDRHRDGRLWTDDTESELIGLSLGGDAEYLTVAGSRSDEGRLLITGADHDINHVAPPKPRLLPGTENLIPVDIANNGNRMEEITVEVGQLPSGWESDGAELLLGPGEQATLNVPIHVAKGQAAKTYALPLTLVSAAGRDPIDIDGQVPEVPLGQTNIKWSWDQAVPGGAPAAFILSIENLGNIPNEMAIGYADLPSGWDAEFVGSTESRLVPGESREVTLMVRAPSDASIGREAWFDVLVAWQNGEERVPITIRVVDGKSYHDDISIEIERDPARDPDLAPLQDKLRGEAQEDAERMDDPYAHTAPKETKESPASGLLFTVLIGLVGAAMLQQRRTRD